MIENGGDTDEAIAGLLHDAVEDQGGEKTLKLIKKNSKICLTAFLDHII